MFDLKEYSLEQIIQALEKVKEEYPAVYKHFFYAKLDPEMYHAIMHVKYSPFNRNDPRNSRITKADLEYLKGEPAPLKITIPVVIEKDEQDT